MNKAFILPSLSRHGLSARLRHFARVGALLLLCAAPLGWAQDNPPPVNINTASAEEIANTLKGIGSQKAQAIVNWREQNGPFTSKEALSAVKGIGESTIDKNSALISLE